MSETEGKAYQYKNSKIINNKMSAARINRAASLLYRSEDNPKKAKNAKFVFLQCCIRRKA